MDAEVEWQLFKAASTAARVCGWNWLGVVANKRHKINPAVEPRGETCSSGKDSRACKAWLRNKTESSSLRSRYAEARKPEARVVKNTKMQSRENLSHKLDANGWQALPS